MRNDKDLFYLANAKNLDSQKSECSNSSLKSFHLKALEIAFLAVVTCHPIPALAIEPSNSADLAQQGSSSTTSARPEIIISANRFEQPRSRAASSVSLISREQIEESGRSTVGEILREVAGVDVVRSGGAGGNSAVFLRGANSEHTLVLMDGIELNNPITTNRSFNFSDLSLEGIERIEILKGSQGALYGSDAMGGVINIITRKGKGDPSGMVQISGGSFGTIRESGYVQGGDKSFQASLSITREDTQGISAADKRDGNTEEDGFQNTGATLRMGGELSDILKLDYTAKAQQSRAEIDESVGVGGDDPNRLVNNREFFQRLSATTNIIEDVWETTLGYGFTDHQLKDVNEADAQRPSTTLDSRYDGNLRKFDLLNKLTFSEDLSAVIGVETETDEGSSSYDSVYFGSQYSTSFLGRDLTTDGYFAQINTAPLEIFNIAFGGRIVDHEIFGSNQTWQIAPNLNFDDLGLRVFSTLGTSFKAPSLYQLYSDYGSQDLQPEESRSWDIGVEQRLTSSVTASATYFKNRFDQMISFRPDTYQFFNILEATSEGVEFETRASLGRSASLVVDYTYTDTADEATEMALLRRAKNKIGVSVEVSPLEKLKLRASARGYGGRWDNDFSKWPAERRRLGGYILANLDANYQISHSLELFLNAVNLLDQSYQEVYGFGTQGIGAFGGMKVRF